MKKILLLLILSANSIFLFSQAWTPVPGFIKWSYIRTFYHKDDKLLIGGGFLSIDSTIQDIGSWDSLTLEPIGNLFQGSAVLAICEYYNKLIIGGDFVDHSHLPYMEYLSHWDGQNWSMFGNYGNPDNSVNTLKIYKNKLYIGGDFNNFGTHPFGGLASWNDTIINTVGTCNHNVNCFEIYNNELITGGYFTAISGNTLYNVARYNGSQWHSLGNGLGGYVAALTVDTINNFLYAGGYIDGGEITPFLSCVARWDGVQWTGVGLTSDLDCDVLALGMYKKYLYAGGCFGIQDSLSTCPFKAVARWDGIQWNSLGSGVNNAVYAFAEYKNELYVGGEFWIAGGDSSCALARWYMPQDTSCGWLQPCVFSNTDTISLNGQGQAQVQFFNNNAYAQNWQWNFGDSGTDSIKNPLHTFTDTGTYTVTVTVTEDGCTKTASKNIVALQYNSISNNEYRMSNIELRIYPNPANSNFTAEIFIPLIERSRNERAATFCIFGLMGEVKREYKLQQGENKITIDTSGWKSETYICNLVVNGRVVKMEKMVLNK